MPHPQQTSLLLLLLKPSCKTRAAPDAPHALRISAPAEIIWVLLFWHLVGVGDSFPAVVVLLLFSYQRAVMTQCTSRYCCNVTLFNASERTGRASWNLRVLGAVCNAHAWRGVIREAVSPEVGESSFWKEAGGCVTRVTARLQPGDQEPPS